MTPDTTQSAGTLHVTDSRTGRSYDLPITDGAIRALDLRQIKVSNDDFGLLSYDPAFMNTASCRSAITFIDGEKGILRYRGYRSTSSPTASPSSTSPTCCCAVSCPTRTSPPRGQMR